MSALIDAARRGESREVERILDEAYADVNEHEGKALGVAAANGHTETVRVLLKRGANPHIPHDNYSLNLAGEEGHVDCVKAFLDSGKGCSLEENEGRLLKHFLRLAAHRGDITMTTFLLERGKAFGSGKETALDTAIIEGRLEMIELMLDRGANIEGCGPSATNWVNSDGSTPLVLAARSAAADVVKLLIGRGAAIAKDDHRALQECCRIGRRDVIEILLKAWDYSSLPDLLLLAQCALGKAEAVKGLLEQGAQANAYKTECLMAAARDGHTEIAKMLLEHGANPDVGMNDLIVRLGGAPMSALACATANGNKEMVALLIGHGADIRKFDDLAIREAVFRNQLEIAVQLLRVYPTNELRSNGKVLGAKNDLEGFEQEWAELVGKELGRRARLRAEQLRKSGAELEP